MDGEQVRCFISIDVEDPGILVGIGRVQRLLAGLGADLKIVESESVHVTLKFLGNVGQGVLQQVEEALGQVRFSPFTLELKGVSAFPSLNRINVVWVGVGAGEAEVEGIYDQVEDRMASLDFKREGRAFNAHITLARARSGRKKEEIARLLGEIGDESFGSFQADRIRLKRSILKPSGPEYSTLYEAFGLQSG